MKKEFTAWAIDSKSVEGHGFIGRFWFTQTTIPTHAIGCKIALFETRAFARTHLSLVKMTFPHATVEKVRVTIESTTQYETKEIECDRCGWVGTIAKHIPLKQSWCGGCRSSRIRLHRKRLTNSPLGGRLKGAQLC